MTPAETALMRECRKIIVAQDALLGPGLEPGITVLLTRLDAALSSQPPEPSAERVREEKGIHDTISGYSEADVGYCLEYPACYDCKMVRDLEAWCFTTSVRKAIIPTKLFSWARIYV